MKEISLDKALKAAGLLGREKDLTPMPFWLSPAIQFMAVKNGVGAECADEALIGHLIDLSIISGLRSEASARSV